MPESNKATLTELSARYFGGGIDGVRQVYPALNGFLVVPPDSTKTTPVLWTPQIAVEASTTLSKIKANTQSLTTYASPSSVVVPLEKRYRNDFEAITLGRDDRNDIRVTSKAISRFHAFIYNHHDQFFIEDKCSSNGTFVNDTPIQTNKQVPLQIGSELRFSNVRALLIDFECLVELIRIVAQFEFCSES